MKKIKLFILLVSLLQTALAQDLPVISQYMFNKLYLNPAYAGTNEELNANLVIRQQWTGTTGAPLTGIFNVDAPIQNQKAGIGLTALFDKKGATSESGLFLNYSYRLRITSNTNLAMGLKGGASFFRAGYNSNDNLNKKDPNDPYFQENVINYFLPKIGAGLYLYNPKYYVGLSVPDLIMYDQKNIISAQTGDARHAPKNYVLMGGTSLFLSDVVTFQPNALVKYYKSSSSPVMVDLNCNFLIKEKILAGASLRPFSSYALMGQIQVKDKIKLGLAAQYQLPGKELPFSYGTYEALITYGIQ